MSADTLTASDDATAASAATAATVFPFLRYDDAPAAIAWLERALGFGVKARYDAPDGSVAHAELALGNGLVMLGSYKDDVLGVTTPRRLGGATHCVCLAVDDVDAVHTSAVAAGADVFWPLADTDYGARTFGCRDREGHVWWLGNYYPDGGGSVAPDLLYADAQAAIAWLEQAFGLRAHLVVPDDKGDVRHAELRWGPSVIMIAASGDEAFAVQTTRRLGGSTGGIYVVVEDVDAHCARARAAGAEIVRGPETMDYGSREYACRDLEGNLWSFGTYRP
jgi:uncharacterized glyoxalase superfamily protein PhnB